MAWNLKYYGHWHGYRYHKAGWAWPDSNYRERIEIYVQNSVTSAEEVTVRNFKYRRSSFDLFTTNDCLVGEGVDMYLISNQPLDFLDIFYTVDPMGVQVRYYHDYYAPDGEDNVPTFIGYVDPEIYHDPISKRLNYEMNITANNGFAVLDRIPFLDDNGDKISGLDSPINIIKTCLDKLGIDYDRIYIGLHTKVGKFDDGGNNDVNHPIYANYSATVNESDINGEGVLHELRINGDNFYDEEENEMTCREVLNTILLPFGAKLFFYDNNVYILDLYGLTLDDIEARVYEYSDLSYLSESSPTTLLASEDVYTINERLEEHSVDMIPGKREVEIVFNKYAQDNPYEIEITEDLMSGFIGQTNYEKDGNLEYKEFRYSNCENFNKISYAANTTFVRRDDISQEGGTSSEYFIRFTPDENNPFWAVQINTGIYVNSSEKQFIGISGQVMAEKLSDYLKQSDIHSNQSYVPFIFRLGLQQSKTGRDIEMINDFYHSEDNNEAYWQRSEVDTSANNEGTFTPYISLREEGAAQYNKWYEINGGSKQYAYWYPGTIYNDGIFSSPVYPLRNWTFNTSNGVEGGYLFLQIYIPKEGDTTVSETDGEWYCYNYLGLAIKNLKIHFLESRNENGREKPYSNVESKDSVYKAKVDSPFKEKLSFDTKIGTDLKVNSLGALYFNKKYEGSGDVYYDCWGDVSNYQDEIEHDRIVRVKYFDRGHNRGYLEDLLLNTYLTNLQQSRYAFSVNLRGYFPPYQVFEFELLKRDGSNVKLFPVSMEYDAVDHRTQFTLEEIRQETDDELDTTD